MGLFRDGRQLEAHDFYAVCLPTVARVAWSQSANKQGRIQNFCSEGA